MRRQRRLNGSQRQYIEDRAREDGERCPKCGSFLRCIDGARPMLQLGSRDVDVLLECVAETCWPPGGTRHTILYKEAKAIGIDVEAH